VTTVLCRSCPADGLCDTNADCSVGSVCIDSGCSSADGSAIKQCVFAGGGVCKTTADCPTGRDCLAVPGERDYHCIKLSAGCDTSFDCVRGFSCEGGECIDRRVPCNPGNGDQDCPKNHTCFGAINSSFCVRIQRDCMEDYHCDGLAPRCANIDGDIDGDGEEKKECAGVFDGNVYPPSACLNSDCTEASAPVCETAAVGSTTVCGQYGLCLADTDCAPTFSCRLLWPDGRKECVPDGGCSSSSECEIQQVCAVPRNLSVAPSCQAGAQP
jgi:hypothetical protein